MVDYIALCIYDKILLIVTYLGCAYAGTSLTFVHVLLFKFSRKHAHHMLIGAIWIHFQSYFLPRLSRMLLVKMMMTITA